MKHLVIPLLVAVTLTTLSACDSYSPTEKEQAAVFNDSHFSQPSTMQQPDNPSSAAFGAPN